MHESFDINSRRQFLSHCGLGLGSMALGSMLSKDCPSLAAETSAHPLAPKAPHFPARAKQVIFLYMTGGPSHLDMLVHKPKLNELDGQPIPESYLKGQEFAQIKEKSPSLLGTRWKFAKHGQCGADVSSLLPHTAKIVDDLAILNTVKNNELVHPFAERMINTGHRGQGRPGLGAWITYGLGSESDELPGFVVMTRDMVPRAHGDNYTSAFLPSMYRGVPLRSRGEPILNLSNPGGVSNRDQRDVVDTANALNRLQYDRFGDPQIAARIAAYEMAFRMQTSAPELADLSGETRQTLDLYGVDPSQPSFGRDCLMARRMVERGVRFVQLFYGDWDHHGDLQDQLPEKCRGMDQASAALVQDLKARGLLDETLVIWGGEFGRTPVRQQQAMGQIGRDHHIEAFTMWMAGGGVKAGHTIGATDELGYYATEDSIHVHDLQASVLHLLGLDHTKLTYRVQGRDYRLTDLGGKVVEKLLD